MKKLRLLLAALALLVISVQVAQAQVKLGDNPGSIDANALLELESTTKGFLLPRMSTVQRLAMPSPSEGMMVYDLTANCTYIYRASAGNWYSLCAADSLTASNGLTKVGRDVQLGGTLNQATNVNQNGNNLNLTGNGSLGVGTNAPNANTRVDIAPNQATDDPLRLQGLRGGASTDSIMTVNAATGILRKRSLADVLKDQDEFVWKLDGNLTTAIRSLGTKSNFALPIITNNVERMRIAATGEVGIGTAAPTNKLTVEDAADPLKLVGLQTAAQTDSLLTINATTGVVRKITIDSVASRGIVAENGINKQGNIVRLGGNLNRPTTVGTDATNTFAVSGLQTASRADSVVLADRTTGVLRRMSLDSIGSNSFTANNALTKAGNNVQFGGALVKPTTVGSDATNTLAITGLQGGVSTDSIVTADAATGVLKRRDVAAVVAAGIDTENGISKTGNKVRLGGTLNQATTLTTSATNTLSIGGLQTASRLDSVVMADGTGTLRRMSLDSVGAYSFTANNGLTKAGSNVKLGGALTQPTVVTTDATNTLSLAGLQTAAMTDSIVTAEGTTGKLRRISMDSLASRGVVAENGLTKTGNVVRLGGTLNRATTVDQASNNMAFTNGKVSVGTATPNATFHVEGSVAMSISTKSAAYTAALSDHTIIADCSSAGFLLTLPAPAPSNAGLTYVIIKGDATGNVLSFSTPIRLSTTQTMPSVNYNVRLHIQSDGTNWWLIARF